MVQDDPTAEGQAQPGALLPCSEEWPKHLLAQLLGDARALVLDVYPDLARPCLCAKGHHAAFGHGLTCVAHEVEQDLAQPLGVGLDLEVGVRELQLETAALRGRIGRGERNHLIEELTQAEAPAMQRGMARVVEELVDDLLEVPQLAPDPGCVASGLGARVQRLAQQPTEERHASKGVADLVGHSSEHELQLLLTSPDGQTHLVDGPAQERDLICAGQLQLAVQVPGANATGRVCQSADRLGDAMADQQAHAQQQPEERNACGPVVKREPVEAAKEGCAALHADHGHHVSALGETDRRVPGEVAHAVIPREEHRGSRGSPQGLADLQAVLEDLREGAANLDSFPGVHLGAQLGVHDEDPPDSGGVPELEQLAPQVAMDPACRGIELLDATCVRPRGEGAGRGLSDGNQPLAKVQNSDAPGRGIGPEPSGHQDEGGRHQVDEQEAVPQPAAGLLYRHLSGGAAVVNDLPGLARRPFAPWDPHPASLP